MSLSTETKSTIVKDYARGETDTGSPEVQVALLSARISELTEHFGEHKKITTAVRVSCGWLISDASCSTI